MEKFWGYVGAAYCTFTAGVYLLAASGSDAALFYPGRFSLFVIGAAIVAIPAGIAYSNHFEKRRSPTAYLNAFPGWVVCIKFALFALLVGTLMYMQSEAGGPGWPDIDARSYVLAKGSTVYRTLSTEEYYHLRLVQTQLFSSFLLLPTFLTTAILLWRKDHETMIDDA